ncbi:MAG TPA: A24 family peptidase [Candidatus Limnocylindrales bacterium]|jgi:prepilin signal peptidase PulO-like enzyme (type II secretory pathway)
MVIYSMWWDEPMVRAAIGAVLGFVWGLAADRIAARWPAHEEGKPPVRDVDWRTPVVALVGAAAGYLVVARFDTEPLHLVLMAVVALGLVLLFATDLDQRLLPDVLTLPLIPLSLVVFALGQSPYLQTTGDLIAAVVAAIVLPLGMYLLSLPFGAGAIGLGDLKLLAGVGLLGGAFRLVAALIVGAIAAAIVIVVLMAARRVTLHSYVPYGPFLILGCLWALLVLSGSGGV